MDKIARFVMFFGALLCLLPSGMLRADDKAYRIGAEDVLDISFWQDQTLDVVVRVGQDGLITLDIIGPIQAAGRTTEELQNEIVRLMSRLNKNISQAVVRVTQYNYNYVYVIGQARTPGKRSFEVIPDLWTVINEAGGINEYGDLSRVTIIRGGREAGKVEVVNVAAALASGETHKLPKINREDTIEIPRVPGGVSAPEMSQLAEKKNIIYVLGAVNRPGPIPFEQNVDLLELLAMAGGERNDADLSKVKVVSKDGAYGQSYQFNLNKYTKSGTPARYVLRKEDAFVVPVRRGSFLGLRADLGTITALVTTASTVFLLVDRFSSNNN